MKPLETKEFLYIFTRYYGDVRMRQSSQAAK